jgi:hypothetical protein
MIFHPPEEKEGDLGTQGSDARLRTIRDVIEAEGIIASAFYLCPCPLALPSETVSQYEKAYFS